MEHTPEETQQKPAGDEQQNKPIAEVPPSRPGILKSTQSSFQPLKQASTKTLRFQMDEHEEPLPAAPLAPTTPTPQEQVSEAGASASPPTQDKPKEVRSKIDVSPPMSLSTENSLSESRSSSTSSSLSQGSGDSDSPERSDFMEERGALSAASAAVPAAPTAPIFKLLGGHKLKLPPWFPEDVIRYFAAPSQTQGDKARDAETRRQHAESGDAEEEDDSSTSLPFEDAPWRPSLPHQTLMALLGGLALVFLVSAMVRDSRRSGDVSTMRQHFEQDVAVSTVNVGENQDSPLPQIPLNDIEEPPQATVTPDKPTFADSENPAEATAPTEASDLSDLPKLQEVLGKVRQMRSGTLRPLRIQKVSLTLESN
ncbi:hypothetical protein V5799_018158 [Amblyomma americanum]|uniref:Uncharacterized protein n=1 Tax=Amblyomma americanum TaxID=6943 RepID=A0AAQ4F0M5_AMBAM